MSPIAQYSAASQLLPSTEGEDVLITHDIGATEKYFHAQKPRKDNQEMMIGIEGFKEARLRFFWNKALWKLLHLSKGTLTVCQLVVKSKVINFCCSGL